MFHADIGLGVGAKHVLKALGKSLAIVEFQPDGRIITANENFRKLFGYELAELKGRDHTLILDPDFAKSADCKDFWTKLAHGEFNAREIKCMDRQGQDVWLQASYNPVAKRSGKVVKIVLVANDI